MKIFDEKNNLIENPDMESGKLIQESNPVTFRYTITQHEQGHYETIAEYPNGGKDVEWVIDTPEEGAWIAYDNDDNEVETDITIPDDAPHEMDIPSFNEYMRYVLYTAEELAEIAEKKKLQEEADAKKAEQEEFLESAPTRMTTVETAVETYISALTSAFGDVN